MPRITITIAPDVYADLCAMRHSYGARSLSQMARAGIEHMLQHKRKATGNATDASALDRPADLTEEIQKMFDNFADTEPQPDGTVPVRHNNRDPYGTR